jgi:hypothetical protein
LRAPSPCPRAPIRPHCRPDPGSDAILAVEPRDRFEDTPGPAIWTGRLVLGGQVDPASGFFRPGASAGRIARSRVNASSAAKPARRSATRAGAKTRSSAANRSIAADRNPGCGPAPASA